MKASLRPSSAYWERTLPPQLGGRLQEVLQLSRAPATLREVVDLLTAGPRRLSMADLCCGASRHRVTMGGETVHTRCVLDALVLAAAKGGAAESLSPLLRQRVVIRIGPDGAAAISPPAAVFSFGVAREGGDAYQALCPYLLAFASEDEYRRWAQVTPEALTIMLSPEEAVSLARDLGCALLGGDVG